MDLRVLTAVFLTLFAVAVGMSQGGLDLQDLRGSLDGLRMSGDLSEILDRAGTTSTNTTITASITTPDPARLDIQAPARLDMGMRPSSTARVGDSTLQTAGNSSITIEGFRGSIRISSTNTTVKGTVTGMSTDNLDFSYSSPKNLDVYTEEPRMSITGLEQQTFKFSNATGTATAGGTTVEVDRERVLFQGFTGNISVEGSSYDIGGWVRTALVGDAAIG